MPPFALMLLSSNLVTMSANTRSLPRSARTSPFKGTCTVFCGIARAGHGEVGGKLGQLEYPGLEIAADRCAELPLDRVVLLLGVDVERQRRDLERLRRALDARELERDVGIALRARELRSEQRRGSARLIGRDGELGRAQIHLEVVRPGLGFRGQRQALDQDQALRQVHAQAGDLQVALGELHAGDRAVRAQGKACDRQRLRRWIRSRARPPSGCRDPCRALPCPPASGPRPRRAERRERFDIARQCQRDVVEVQRAAGELGIQPLEAVLLAGEVEGQRAGKHRLEIGLRLHALDGCGELHFARRLLGDASGLELDEFDGQVVAVGLVLPGDARVGDAHAADVEPDRLGRLRRWRRRLGSAFSPPPVRSPKLVLPSLCLTRLARSPSTRTSSTTTWRDSSGSSARYTCAWFRPANSAVPAGSDRDTLPTSAPIFGNTLSPMSPSMVSVRPVLSFTSCTICGL